MGFHNQARDYLFREFIEKNYQDINKTAKKKLLGTSPDNILKDKLSIHQHKYFHKALIEAMDLCLQGLDNLHLKLLDRLHQEAKPIFISLWLPKAGEQIPSLIHYKGTIPKSIKDWNIKKDQLFLLSSKCKKNIPFIIFKEETKKIFGEEILDVMLHPISFQNKFIGFVLSSGYNRDVELSESYFSFFIRLISMVVYLPTPELNTLETISKKSNKKTNKLASK